MAATKSRGRGGDPRRSPKTPASGNRSGTANGTDPVVAGQVDESDDPFGGTVEPKRRRPKVVAEYIYTDESGGRVLKVRRWEPGHGGRRKSFTQHAWAGDGWAKNARGARLVPYRLPEVIAAVAAGEPIYIPEGEKDVHAIEAVGRVATTNPGGARKWRREFAEHFVEADVRVVADRDEAGARHALSVYENVRKATDKVSTFLPAEGCKDVADHLAAGHNLDALVPVTPEGLAALAGRDQADPDRATAGERPPGVPLVLRTLVGLLADRGPVVPPREPLGDWGVCCPVHDDKNPSATLRAGTDRPVVFKCHAGCEPADFFAWCQAQGVPLGDLMDWNRPDRGDGSTWEPVDLAGVLSGDVEPELPTIGQRDDGGSLIYPAKVHSFAGEPESAKSLLLQFVCVQEIEAGHHIVYVDYEDTAHGVVGRLRDLGLTDEQIGEFFHYVRPDEPFAAGLDRVVRLVAECQPTLIVLDGVTEAMSVEGGSPLDVLDVAHFLQGVVRKLVDLSGAAVVMIDHVTKATDTQGRWAFGSQHKLAGIQVGYVMRIAEPFVRGVGGRSKLTISKDRPGWVRAQSVGGSVAGHLAMYPDPREPGRMVTKIEAPTESDARSVEGGPGLEAEIVRIVTESPFVFTMTEIQNMVGGGKKRFDAIWKELAVTETSAVLTGKQIKRPGKDDRERPATVWGLK